MQIFVVIMGYISSIFDMANANICLKIKGICLKCCTNLFCGISENVFKDKENFDLVAVFSRQIDTVIVRLIFSMLILLII